jgi:hypothetical protein
MGVFLFYISENSSGGEGGEGMEWSGDEGIAVLLTREQFKLISFIELPFLLCSLY